MKKYKVYDLYEGKECIGYADTLREVKKIARTQYTETDGECAIYYTELNRDTGEYDFAKRKFISLI